MSRLTIYIGAFALIIIAGLGFAVKWQYSQIQDLKTATALLEAKNEAITKQANRYANRPRTDDDVTDRLCNWAARIQSSDNKAKRGVPLESCP